MSKRAEALLFLCFQNPHQTVVQSPALHHDWASFFGPFGNVFSGGPFQFWNRLTLFEPLVVHLDWDVDGTAGEHQQYQSGNGSASRGSHVSFQSRC